LRELAAEFGASFHTVSGAIEILCRDDLAMRAPGRGCRVLPPQDRLHRSVICVIYAPPRLPHTIGTGQQRVVDGIQQTLQRHGYRFEAINYNDTPLSPDEIVERYGAVISAVDVDREGRVLMALEARRIPLVVANLEPDWNLTATFVDHCKTTRHAVRTLVAMGHRRIGFVTRSPRIHFYGKAREGYILGLQEAGIELDERLIVEAAGPENLSGYIAARRLLDVRPLPTAIVAARDYLAHGAYQAFTEAGYVIGKDVSLIGFDDVTWPQEEPFLTTFREPNYELGAVAAEMLIDRIVNGWRPPEKRELECEFILRRTVAPLVSQGGVAVSAGAAGRR